MNLIQSNGIVGYSATTTISVWPVDYSYNGCLGSTAVCCSRPRITIYTAEHYSGSPFRRHAFFLVRFIFCYVVNLLTHRHFFYVRMYVNRRSVLYTLVRNHCKTVDFTCAVGCVLMFLCTFTTCTNLSHFQSLPAHRLHHHLSCSFFGLIAHKYIFL